MQKILLIALAAIFIVFYMQLHFGLGGYADDKAVLTKIKLQQQVNQQLIKRNRDVGVKITSLKGSSDALEVRARSELNLIKPGEALVILPNTDESASKNNLTSQPMKH